MLIGQCWFCSGKTFRKYSENKVKCIKRSHVYISSFNCINVTFTSKPDWFLSANPLGKVPTLILPQEDNGPRDVLYESVITSEYLDQAFSPDQSLRPKDPKQLAKDKIVLMHYDKVYFNFKFLKRNF